MSKQELDPPREAWETAEYEDDPFGLGDVDETKLKIVSKDFLPRPEDLFFRRKGVKVALTLSEESLHYFKEQAERLQTPYQRIIRNLIDEYVKRQQTRS
jgi:predicted DNA binding CopG/RHH family protein